MLIVTTNLDFFAFLETPCCPCVDRTCVTAPKNEKQAAWSIVFAQEELVGSAVILVLIAISLAMAVIGLAPFKTETRIMCFSASFWTVHFPIGLHGGWVLAGELLG